MKHSPSDPITRRSPYWLLIAAVPVFHAVLRAIRTYVVAKMGKGAVDWGDVIFTFLIWLAFGLLALPLIYLLAHYYPIRRGKVSRVVWIHILGFVAFTLIWAAFTVLIGLSLHRFPAAGNLLLTYREWLITTLLWSVFLYPLMVGCFYGFTYYNEAKERESQQARLAAQLAEARLSALRMQLNPHFLFNSLNAITVLMRDQQSREASQMLEQLSDILRQVLRSNPRGETTLNEDLAFLEKYLAIEQVRFSDRLKIKWAIHPAIGEAVVPEFILQPLVENAVRHGIAALADDGVIEISAAKANGELVLSVRDNGAGYHPAFESEGLGLSNTRERLATLYGDAGGLNVVNAPDGGTVATVHFPFKIQ
jgi:glucose-6-phosphate-specific signal transduction histidine kinase